MNMSDATRVAQLRADRECKPFTVAYSSRLGFCALPGDGAGMPGILRMVCVCRPTATANLDGYISTTTE